MKKDEKDEKKKERRECIDCGREIFRDPKNMGPSGSRCMNCLALWELS
jgi:hypothetical protein